MDQTDAESAGEGGEAESEAEAGLAPILVTPEADPHETLAPEVAFVVPPPIAEATDTHREPEPEPQAEPEPDRPDPVLTALATLNDAVIGRLDGLQTRFDREIRAEATREKVVDRLHAELQEYKQGLLLGILRPVFVDLIQLHDDIGKMTAAKPGEPFEGEAAAWVDRLDGIRQGIVDVLYRQGVEPFTVEGEAFDPRRQRALATVPNDDPARARTVAARVRVGFQAGDKVIRPEVVTVHAAPPPPPPIRSDDAR